ncbi:MAG: sigma-E processing peptidase SpoIIGA [Lachnospiraceae bacterium]|nr:sigma-E processing peptidase SpoIIGA [Lachnospiraceae bacterium]
MFYVVYIDVLFLVNFFMDYIILTLTGNILKIHTRIWRRCLGAALGATCYCIMLFLPTEYRMHGSMGIMLFVGAMMGILVFSLRKPKKILVFLLIFHATAFFLGGTVTAIYHYTRLGYYIRKAVKGDDNAQIITGVLAGMVLAACGLMKIILSCIRERRREETLYYEVELCVGDTKKSATALMDTGNHLKEPVSHKPVILADITLAGELLDEKTYKAIKAFYLTGNLTQAEGLRLIPYHSVGRKHGILAAVFIDSLIIRMEQGVIERNGVCVAITEDAISSGEEYRVILNAALVE